MGAKENTHLKGAMYEIYHSEHDDQWRYTLGTIGKRPLITIGLNPSTATQEKLDNTVTKVEKVAQQCGFDSFIMLNLYPVRATDPKGLPPKADPVAYERNLEAIEKTVAQLFDQMHDHALHPAAPDVSVDLDAPVEDADAP